MLTRLICVSIACSSILSLGGCKGISQARPDLPRVEVEVTVAIDSSFGDKLDGVDEAFRQKVADQVVSHGDVGLRFYPVLSEKYAKKQVRPPYRMTVVLSDFVMGTAKQTHTEVDGETKTITTSRWVNLLSCTATTTLEKRRDNGPALLVERGQSVGSVSLQKARPGAPIALQHKVKMDALSEDQRDTKQAIHVADSKILDVVDQAVQNSLESMIAAIDRELLLQNTQPQVAAPR